MIEIDTQKIISQLWDFAEKKPHHYIYALLDAARDPKIYSGLQRFGPEYLCLYRDTLPDELARNAPYLVALTQKHKFTEWLIENGWANSWGIFAVTNEDLFDAITHFRQLVKVKDEKGKILYFRYYDPRVMRMYLPTCMAKELFLVFGKVGYFIMEDELGNGLKAFSFNKVELIEQEIVFEEKTR